MPLSDLGRGSRREAATGRLVICVRSVFICGETVKGRTLLIWTVGLLAIVVLIGVGGAAWLAFMSLEKGEQHRRQFHRLFGISRLPARVPGVLRADREPRHEGGGGGTAGLPDPCAPVAPDEGPDRHESAGAGIGFFTDRFLLRPRAGRRTLPLVRLVPSA